MNAPPRATTPHRSGPSVGTSAMPTRCLCYLGVSTVLIVVAATQRASSPVRHVIEGIVIASWAAAVIARRRSLVGKPWPWFAMAGTAFVIGYAFAGVDSIRAGVASEPTIGDAFYGVGYALMAYGMLAYGRVSKHGARWASIDSAIVTIGLASLGWFALFDPHLRDTTLGPTARAVSAAYPMLDLVLLGLTVRMAFARGVRVASNQLFVLGAMTLVATDALFFVDLLDRAAVPAWVDLGWLFAAVLAGAAILHESMGEVATDRDGSGADQWVRVTALAVSPLLPFVELVARGNAGFSIDDEIIAALAVVALGLMLVRMVGLVRALVAAEANYRGIFENALEGIWQTKPDGSFLSVNPAMARMFGFSSPEEFLREVPNGAVLYRDPVMRQAIADQLTRDGVVPGVELDVRRRDGTPLRLSVSIRATRGADGAFVTFEGVAVDVTERHAAQQQVQETLTMFREVIEGSTDGIFVKDLAGRYLMSNGVAAQRAGLAPEQMVGRDDIDISAVDVALAARKKDREVLSTGVTQTYEMESPTAAGERRLYAMTKGVYRRPDGAVMGVFGISRDVTERRAEEIAIRLQKELLETIFERIPTPVVVSSAQGRIEMVNRAWEELSGWSGDAMNAAPDVWAEMLPDARTREDVVRCLEVADGEPRDRAVRMRDGRVLDMVWASVNLSDGRRVSVGMDVTDRRRAERQLEERLVALRRLSSERRHLLERLVGAQEEERRRIAADVHDDPVQAMTAAKMRVEMVQRQTTDPAAAAALRDVMASILESIVRLRNLVFDLRPQTLDEEGVAWTVRTLVERTAVTDGPVFEVIDELEREPEPAIRVAVYRILQEAIKNVQKHARATRATIELTNRDGGMWFAVIDDGVGFLGNGNGNGRSRPGHLGIAAMRERAEMLGGWCRIASVPGRTQVEGWVPLEDRQDAGVDRAETMIAARPKGR